jgi:hypothetical protein
MKELPYSPGAKYCQCNACGELFNSVTGFDWHRVGDYETKNNRQGVVRCLTPAEMAAKGWSLNKRGMWITERWAGAEDAA